MNYQVVEKNSNKYIRLNHEGNLIQTERDGLELLSLCAENETNLLLIPDVRLADEFFSLKSGLAGAILQKFTQYGVQAALVLETNRVKGKFKDLLIESNQGAMFRAYTSFDEAERWLLNGTNNQGGNIFKRGF